MNQIEINYQNQFKVILFNACKLGNEVEDLKIDYFMELIKQQLDILINQGELILEVKL